MQRERKERVRVKKTAKEGEEEEEEVHTTAANISMKTLFLRNFQKEK